MSQPVRRAPATPTRARARAPSATAKKERWNKSFDYHKQGRKWPNDDDMKRAPVISVLQYKANTGKEQEIETELTNSVDEMEAERGVDHAALYKLVKGPDDSADYLFVLVTENAAVTKRLVGTRKYKDKHEKLKRLSKFTQEPSVNMTLVDRISE